MEKTLWFEKENSKIFFFFYYFIWVSYFEYYDFLDILIFSFINFLFSFLVFTRQCDFITQVGARRTSLPPRSMLHTTVLSSVSLSSRFWLYFHSFYF